MSDDTPMDKDLVSRLAALVPGAAVVDAMAWKPEDLPAPIKAHLADLQRRMARSYMEGLCLHCGKKMPGYPLLTESVSKDWKPHPGWEYYQNGRFPGLDFWVCPDCEVNRDSGSFVIHESGASSELLAIPKEQTDPEVN